jgi:transcriptional regulator with XRE-family HTH domain
MSNYNLKQEIKKLGMTQKGFAEHIGVSENSVSTWVRGETPIPVWLPNFIHYYKKSKLLDELKEKINDIK